MQIVFIGIAWSIKSCFLGKNKKNIIDLSSAELAQRVVKVKEAVIGQAGFPMTLDKEIIEGIILAEAMLLSAHKMQHNAKK